MLFIALIFLIYFSLATLLFIFQKNFIFFPPEKNLLRYHSWKSNEINISGEYDLQAWHIHNNNITNGKAIVYFGGNAEDVSSGLELTSKYNTSHVFYINLNGYGQSSGVPSEKNFFNSGLYALKYICKNFNISESSVILIGRSLGSATAIHVAGKINPLKLIIITPFQSIKKMVPDILRIIFPMSLILINKFDNEKNIKQVKCPILVLAASNDEVIPLNQTKNVFSSAQSKTVFKIIENTNHQNILLNKTCLNEINNFIK